MLQSYPDLPVMDPSKIRTFTDYAYASHDQAEFILKAMDEIRSMHDSHFMTKKNKELIKEKKALMDELSLVKSQGPVGENDEQVEKMRVQLDAAQKAHRTTA